MPVIELLPAPTNQPTLDDAEEKVYNSSCFCFQLADPCFQASESGSAAQHPTVMPCLWRSSQGLTDEECEEEYLNSFHTKFITLKDSQKLDRYVTLDQLRVGIISMQDIVDPDGSEQCEDGFSSTVSLLSRH